MDLQQHLIRQMAFSHATFGPGTRTEGVTDHIRKELEEVLQANGDRNDPKHVAAIACGMIEGKQARNEARNWPDWRKSDPNKAIEHVK